MQPNWTNDILLTFSNQFPSEIRLRGKSHFILAIIRSYLRDYNATILWAKERQKREKRQNHYLTNRYQHFIYHIFVPNFVSLAAWNCIVTRSSFHMLIWIKWKLFNILSELKYRKHFKLCNPLWLLFCTAVKFWWW